MQNNKINIRFLFKLLLGCIALFMLSASLAAQHKDSLKAAKVWKGKSAATLIEHKFDRLEKRFFQLGDATSLLEANSNTYIRNYGISNLSTLSIRGSSVAQTTVLWNGIPIQNNMLGLTDLSTLPNFFFDKMSVYSSGFNKKGTVQSMAGRLELNNQSNFSMKPLWRSTVLMGYESFENIILGAGLNFSSKKWNAKIKYYNRQGKNRYTFNNYYTNQYDTIEHAFAVQEQVMADVAFRPNKNHQFDFHFWRLENYRQIAPLAFDNNKQRSERNKVSRIGLNHIYSKGKWLVKSNVGYTADSFIYEDRHAVLSTIAKVENFSGGSALSYFMNETSDIGISYNHQLSYYKQLNRNEGLNQLGGQIFYNNRNLWKGLGANLFLQKQYASIGKNPLTYGVRVSKLIFDKHLLYASFNTNYRLPTLNELYYFPGGNIDLLPESSKNLELGYGIQSKVRELSFDNKLSVYSRWVDDWIIWTGSAIFFPDNIANVWSRGLENTLNVTYIFRDWQLRNTLLYAYNRATSEDAYFVNDGSIGKQIPYVPVNSWRNNFYARYKKISAQCNLNYTGYRFITRDESEYVDDYAVLNFYLGYELLLKKQVFQLQLKVNNLLNEEYESVRGRIMPRRNYAFSFIWESTY